MPDLPTLTVTERAVLVALRMYMRYDEEADGRFVRSYLNKIIKDVDVPATGWERQQIDPDSILQHYNASK